MLNAKLALRHEKNKIKRYGGQQLGQMVYAHLESKLRLGLVRGLEHNAERPATSTAQRPEQVGILARIRNAQLAVRRHDLDFHLIDTIRH